MGTSYKTALKLTPRKDNLTKNIFVYCNVPRPEAEITALCGYKDRKSLFLRHFHGTIKIYNQKKINRRDENTVMFWKEDLTQMNNEINTGRQKNIDYAKALAIVFYDSDTCITVSQEQYNKQTDKLLV